MPRPETLEVDHIRFAQSAEQRIRSLPRRALGPVDAVQGGELSAKVSPPGLLPGSCLSGRAGIGEQEGDALPGVSATKELWCAHRDPGARVE